MQCICAIARSEGPGDAGRGHCVRPTDVWRDAQLFASLCGAARVVRYGGVCEMQVGVDTVNGAVNGDIKGAEPVRSTEGGVDVGTLEAAEDALAKVEFALLAPGDASIGNGDTVDELCAVGVVTTDPDAEQIVGLFSKRERDVGCVKEDDVECGEVGGGSEHVEPPPLEGCAVYGR